MGALRARFEIQYSSAYCAARARARRYFENRRAREHWLLPGRLGTFHVWFNANRTLHVCGCACAGAWVKACAVGACGWGASFRLSFVVQLYVTAPSQVNAAFFARWVPLGGNHIDAKATSGGSGCLGAGETTWRCAVREACSRGRGGRVTVHLERGRRPLAAALEPDRHLSEVDKGGAESLRSPTRSSAPGLLEEHLAHAVPVRNGARPAGRPRDVACRPRPAGRELWRVVLRPRGA